MKIQPVLGNYLYNTHKQIELNSKFKNILDKCIHNDVKYNHKGDITIFVKNGG